MMRLKLKLVWCRGKAAAWKPLMVVRWRDSQSVSQWSREPWSASRERVTRKMV